MQDDGDADYVRRASSKLAVEESLVLLSSHDIDANVDSSLTPLIRGLFDSWSEVRSDSAKILERHQTSLSIHVQERIADILQPVMEQAANIGGGGAIISSAEGGSLALGPTTSTTTTTGASVSEQLLPIPWQKLHGALKGLHAIIDTLSISTHTHGNGNSINSYSYQDTLRISCIILQGHVRLPVREEARKCLLSLSSRSTTAQQRALVASVLVSLEKSLSKGKDKSIQLQSQRKSSGSSSSSSNSSKSVSTNNVFTTLETRATAAVTESISDLDEEYLAYFVEGLIQALNGILHQLPSLETLGVLLPIDTDSTAGDTSTQKTILQRVIDALLFGMADLSSTVRQSAGSGLTALLLRCANNAHNSNSSSSSSSSSSSLYVSIHGQALTAVAEALSGDSTSQDWRHLESCVLVAEEVLRYHLTQQLEIMREEGIEADSSTSSNNNSNTFKSKTLLSILLPKKFCCSAQDTIPKCLLHRKFEIRRVGSQLLPTLTRYLTLFNPQLLFRLDSPWVMILEKSNWPETWRNGTGSNTGTSTNTCANVNEDCVRHLLVALAWTSEAAKAQQHIIETLQQTASYRDSGVDVVSTSTSTTLAMSSPTHRHRRGHDHGAISENIDINSKYQPGQQGQDNERKQEQEQEHIPGSVCWALEVRSRLAEDEAKQRFHADLRRVLSSKHAKACGERLIHNMQSVRQDTVRLVACLADCWRAAVETPAAATAATTTSKAISTDTVVCSSIAEGKVEHSAAIAVTTAGVGAVIISADLIEATALACAIVHDLGPQAQSMCPDVCLSLTCDSTWVTSCFILASLSMQQQQQQQQHSGSSSSSSRVVILSSVTDPTTEVRLNRNSTLSFTSANSGTGTSISNGSSIDHFNSGVVSPIDCRLLRAAHRWACESIAPVLPLFTTQQAKQNGCGSDYRLGFIISTWALACVGDALWLDHRPHARRVLFRSLLHTLPDMSLLSDMEEMAERKMENKNNIQQQPKHEKYIYDLHVSRATIQAHIRLLVAATAVSCGSDNGNNNGTITASVSVPIAIGGSSAIHRDLGQQRGLAVEASEIGILVKCCRIMWGERIITSINQSRGKDKKDGDGEGVDDKETGSTSTSTTLFPIELKEGLRSSVENVRSRLWSATGHGYGYGNGHSSNASNDNGSRPNSTRSSPVKVTHGGKYSSVTSSTFPLRYQTPKAAAEHHHALVCSIVEDEGKEGMGMGPVVASKLFTDVDVNRHIDVHNNAHVNTANKNVLDEMSDPDEIEEEKEDEFSDWDEESEDELNVSSNSVTPLMPADGEIAAALVEVDLLLEML